MVVGGIQFLEGWLEEAFGSPTWQLILSSVLAQKSLERHCTRDIPSVLFYLLKASH